MDKNPAFPVSGSDKVKLEKLKVICNLIAVLVTVIVGTFGVAWINNDLQNRKLEQQERSEKAKLEQQKLHSLSCRIALT